MRFSPRFLIFLSFFVLVLTSSITSAVKCPENITQSVDSEEEFTVFIKISKSEEHKDFLIKCLNRHLKKFKSGEDRFDKDKNKKIDKTLITDYSLDDTKLEVYSGFFDAQFAKDNLAGRDDVDIVEKATPVEANYAINRPTIFEDDNLTKRTTQTSAPFNLDRIDQNNFPLDGSYTYPTNAGLETNVYVLDTGIDVKNVEFEGRARFGGSFCSGCSSTDDHGHGTNVAGIIGGKKFGVSKKTKLISVKILNQNGQGSSVTVVAGLSFVLSEHKKSSNKNTVINLSLGGSFSQSINKMVSDCVNAGIHVVVSAGDNAGDACNISPASAPQAITVGATEKSKDVVASFTNTGSCVDIYAPGRDIIAAGANLTTSISQASGTSQACPHVAGTIALIISKQGNSSPSSMTTALINLSVKNILNANPNRFLLVPKP